MTQDQKTADRLKAAEGDWPSMSCGCPALSGVCEHMIAEWRKQGPSAGPFVRIRALEAENAKLRAALEKIAYANLPVKDGFTAMGFIHLAAEALQACDADLLDTSTKIDSCNYQKDKP